MLTNLLSLYPDYNRWYGPTLHQKEGRFFIYLYNSDTKKRTTIQYAKALIECNLGRRLIETEEVDHIDNDKTNDDLINLQILTNKEHKAKKGLTLVEIICAYCSSPYMKSAYRINQAYKARNNPKFYCSTSCKINARR